MPQSRTSLLRFQYRCINIVSNSNTYDILAVKMFLIKKYNTYIYIYNYSN